GLIRAWEHPLFWSRVVGWLSTTGTLPLFYLAVREATGDIRQAGWATLLLALYYVHAWMAGTAYAEGPYALALMTAVWLALHAARGGGGARGRDAGLARGAVAGAVLPRHPGKLAGAAAA